MRRSNGNKQNERERGRKVSKKIIFFLPWKKKAKNETRKKKHKDNRWEKEREDEDEPQRK